MGLLKKYIGSKKLFKDICILSGIFDPTPSPQLKYVYIKAWKISHKQDILLSSKSP